MLELTETIFIDKDLQNLYIEVKDISKYNRTTKNSDVNSSNNNLVLKNYGAQEFLSLINNLDNLKKYGQTLDKQVDELVTCLSNKSTHLKIDWKMLHNNFREIVSFLPFSMTFSYLFREMFMSFIDKYYTKYPSCLADELSETDFCLVSFYLKTFNKDDNKLFSLNLSQKLSPNLYDISAEEYSYNLIEEFKTKSFESICYLEKMSKKIYEASNQTYTPRTSYSPFDNDIAFLSIFQFDKIYFPDDKNLDWEKIEFKKIQYPIKKEYCPDKIISFTKYQTTFLFQIFFITLENLKETNLKFQRCHQCKNIFSERNRSKYCSPQCGEKAKYLRYISKGFNKDYHRIRKKLYQLHDRTTRNRLSRSDFFSLYEEFKSELSLLTLTSRTLEDFVNKGEACYKKYKDKYKQMHD